MPGESITVQQENAKASEEKKQNWWQNQKAKLMIGFWIALALSIGGLCTEISSDIFTMQLAYSLADKDNSWFDYFIINWSVLAWCLAGLGFDIGKTFVLPLSIQAMSRGIHIKGFLCFLFGSISLVVSLFGTIGALSAHSKYEKDLADANKLYLDQKNKTYDEIDNQIEKNKELATQKSSISDAWKKMSKNSIKTKTFKMNLANSASNKAIEIQNSSNALLSQKLNSIKLNEVKKDNQLTSLYESIALTFLIKDHFNDENLISSDKEKKEYTKKNEKEFNNAVEKARISFQMIFSVGQELLGILMMTLGINFIADKNDKKRTALPLKNSEKNNNKTPPEPATKKTKKIGFFESILTKLKLLKNKPASLGTSLENKAFSKKQENLSLPPAGGVKENQNGKIVINKDNGQKITTERRRSVFERSNNAQNVSKISTPDSYKLAKEFVNKGTINCSVNAVKNHFKIGHEKAKEYFKRMEVDGVVIDTGRGYVLNKEYNSKKAN